MGGVIHYHGTPITPIEQLLRMAGRHFCVSFADGRDLHRVLAIGQSAMFDNGAWSAFTRGEPFDEHGLYRWLEPVLGHPHWAVVPDVIDGTLEQQRELESRWPFGREFGAPVWHLHEPVERLLELADTWPRVCLGSSGQYLEIGAGRWSRRMDEAFNALAQRHRRLPWIHGLRMLGQAGGPYPLASADSTNVAQSIYRPPNCSHCLAAPIDAVQTPSLWNPRPLQTEML